MKFINIKNLSFFLTIVSVLTLFTVACLFLISALKQNNLLSQQIKNKKVDLEVVHVPLKEYGALKEDLNKKNSQLAEIKKRLFWERDISKFLNELTRLASDLEIEFISLKPETMPEEEEDRQSDKKKSKETKTLAQVPIAVVFKSSYNDIINFLKRIEAGERFIRIDSLSIESEPRNIHKHLANIKLSIFIIEKGG